MFKTALYSALFILASSTASLASSTEEAFFKLKATQPEGKFPVTINAEDGYNYKSKLEIDITISAGRLIIPEDYCYLRVGNYVDESEADRDQYLPKGSMSITVNMIDLPAIDEVKKFTKFHEFTRRDSSDADNLIWGWLIEENYISNALSDGGLSGLESPFVTNVNQFYEALEELWQECQKL